MIPCCPDKFQKEWGVLLSLVLVPQYLTNELEKLKVDGATSRITDKFEKLFRIAASKILKPLADQQIAFDPDDGVTGNYAKLKPAVALIK